MTDDFSRKLFLALAEAYSCLASELAKRKCVEVADLATAIQTTAEAHTRIGNATQAGFLRAISNHLVDTAKRA